MRIGLVYRGAIRTCNYGCGYCPIPRRGAPARRERADAADTTGLARFAELAAARRDDELAIVLAPRGEGLVHGRWRDATLALAALPNVRRVAVQTNLSGPIDWLRGAAPGKVELWASFHPTEVAPEPFARRLAAAAALGAGVSAGAVAIPGHLGAVEALQRILPEDVYLWLNRPHGARPLSPADLARARAIDPWFQAAPPRSRGRACGAGASVLFVDGDGTARRCLGVTAARGNVHEAPLEALLRPVEPCPAPVCRCFLGYVHLLPLGLEGVFGGDGLSRIPRGWTSRARGSPGTEPRG